MVLKTNILLMFVLSLCNTLKNITADMKKITIIYFVIGIAVVIGLLYFAFNFKKPVALTPKPDIDPSTLAGIQTGNYPWPVEVSNLQKRLTEIGLPALQQEGTVLHTHQHLDIFINGKQITVPANIGLDDAKGFIAEIHTHDETGIIHVESPVAQKFYLGQFFDIWGVKLASNCVGGYCNDANNNLKAYVNGNLFQGDPRTIELQAHQEIAIAYGTILQMPFPVPSSYDFPAGF